MQKVHSREEWGAQDPCGSPINTMASPQSRSIIYHTSTDWTCEDSVSSNSNLTVFLNRMNLIYLHKLQANCTQTLVDIQSNICATVKDVNYAFIIGGAGDFAMVMEGRGFSYVGDHYTAYNSLSISIALIGEFKTMIPGD